MGSTVEQQPVGKLVQQSFGEVQHVKFSKPTQPKPKPVCDRSGQPDDTQDVFVVKGETSRSHEINEEGFHEKLCVPDRSGQPDERNSSSAHTVKEQFAPEVHREIALLNTDNEFNRAINEEDIDFNIPRRRWRAGRSFDAHVLLLGSAQRTEGCPGQVAGRRTHFRVFG